MKGLPNDAIQCKAGRRFWENTFELLHKRNGCAVAWMIMDEVSRKPVGNCSVSSISAEAVKRRVRLLQMGFLVSTFN